MDSRSNWNLEVLLVFDERGKPEYPEKNLTGQGREPITNSTHMWLQRRDLNPGHIGGRRVLSPLHHPCSPWSKFLIIHTCTGISLMTNNIKSCATQLTEPVCAITIVGSEISIVQSRKKKPILKTSKFQSQMWSAARWKNVLEVGRSLSLSYNSSLAVRDLC